MKRALVGVLAAVMLLGVRPAWASHTDQTDPDDVAGRLDLEAVMLRHDAQPFVWTFRTFGEWRPREIWDRGYLLVELETRGDQDVDYVALVRSTGRRLEGVLLRTRLDGKQVKVRGLDAWKAGPDGAAIAVPLDALRFGASRTSFRWSATSLFTGNVCRATCIDRVPDDGLVVQELPPPEA